MDGRTGDEWVVAVVRLLPLHLLHYNKIFHGGLSLRWWWGQEPFSESGRLLRRRNQDDKLRQMDGFHSIICNDCKILLIALVPFGVREAERFGYNKTRNIQDHHSLGICMHIHMYECVWDTSSHPHSSQFVLLYWGIGGECFVVTYLLCLLRTIHPSPTHQSQIELHSFVVCTFLLENRSRQEIGLGDSWYSYTHK